MAKLSKNKAKTAIIKHLGNMTMAAKACGVTRSYFHQYVKKHNMQHIVAESREMLIDNLENKAMDVAMRGNPSMLQFLLRTQGKQRGYVEKQEVDQTQEITVTYDRSQPIHPPPETADDKG